MRTHPTPRARHSRALRALAAAGAILTLTGCGLVGIRTSDEPGGPLGVAIAPTQGPEPEPTETGPQIPEGWELHRADFAGECNSRLEVALPPSVKATPGTERGAFIYFTFGSPHDKMVMNISCNESFRQSPVEELQFEKEYEFSYGDSTKLADRDVRVDNGAGWAYKAEVNEKSSLMIGLVGGSAAKGYAFAVYAAQQAEGRMETISVTTVALEDSPEAVEAAEEITQNVYVDKQLLIIPDWQ
ncbi:hypothetical protein M3B11_12325 [Brevibacterium sp. p3-SID960]|uniref:hypothetical protein n=1 Tax=Brevibacterium sp. p3-SID960 TaxID=2916063 RepID=UPI0021A89710|nr:hypothetical protein [Brevibacterium sp. p3-SID960]MCT1691719.1 hypothetical protein [Brevibacterium sp. p3-SID960]